MAKKKKSVSDSTLSKLWSQAVLSRYRLDPLGLPATDAHHIIPKGRQNRFALRWDIRNGIGLSRETHRRLHDGDLFVIELVIESVRDRGDYQYLQGLKNKMKPDFLFELGESEDEYRQRIKRELKEIAQE